LAKLQVLWVGGEREREREKESGREVKKVRENGRERERGSFRSEKVKKWLLSHSCYGITYKASRKDFAQL